MSLITNVTMSDSFSSPKFCAVRVGSQRLFSMTLGLLGLVAFGLSSYLFSVSLTQSGIAGCSGEIFDCNSVLQSRWSTWMGIPVSGLAAASYFVFLTGLLSAELIAPTRRTMAWMLVSVVGFSACLAAIWFISLQVFVIKHFCVYCMFAHCCGICIGMGLLMRRPLGWKGIGYSVSLAFAGIVVLAAGQVFAEEKESFELITYPEDVPTDENGLEGLIDPLEGMDDNIFDAPGLDDFDDFDFSSNSFHPVQPTVDNSVFQWMSLAQLFRPHFLLVDHPSSLGEPAHQEKQEASGAGEATQQQQEQQQDSVQPAERRLAEVLNGKIKMDIKQWPMAGSTEAELVVVEMFDYNCSHCRSTHVAVKGAKERMGDRLAVIVMPVPLNPACNNQVQQSNPQFYESCELAKLAIAVWRVDQEKFCEFHDWMFEGGQRRTLTAARARAESLVDQERLQKVLNSTLPSAFIDKHVEVYKAAGGGTIPKLLFRNTAIIGEYRSIDGLVNLINQHGQVTVMPIE